MAVAFDATANGYIEGASSLTISMTVGSGANRALVVFATCLNSTDFLASATVTWNGTSMGSPVVSTSTGTQNATYAWVLVAPASGTHNVVITPSGSAYINAEVASFTNVNQSSPVSTSYGSTFNTTTPYSHTITVAAGEMAVDQFYSRATGSTIAPGGSQTALGSQVNTSLSSFLASYQSGSGVMSWSFTGGSGVFDTYLALALGAAPTSAFSGAVTLDDLLPTGTFATVASGFTGAVTLDDGAPAGSFGPTPGTIASDPLETNNGSVLANVALNYVAFYDSTTGALVVRKTGISTDASGIFTVTDPALRPGTTYRVDWEVATTLQRRMPKRAAS